MARRGVEFSFFHLFTVGEGREVRGPMVLGPTVPSQGRSKECLSPAQTARLLVRDVTSMGR